MAALPTVYKMLTAAITAATQGTSAPIYADGRSLLSFYFRSTGTTSSGTFLIEEAYYDPKTEPVYAGTWSLIATVLASSFTGGAQVAYHMNPTALASFRVRQTVDVGGGGSVDVVGIVNDKLL